MSTPTTSQFGEEYPATWERLRTPLSEPRTANGGTLVRAATLNLRGGVATIRRFGRLKLRCGVQRGAAGCQYLEQPWAV